MTLAYHKETRIITFVLYQCLNEQDGSYLNSGPKLKLLEHCLCSITSTYVSALTVLPLHYTAHMLDKALLPVVDYM